MQELSVGGAGIVGLEGPALWLTVAWATTVLAYALRAWRGRGASPGVDVLFVVAALGTLIAVHTTAPFTTASSAIVMRTGLPAVMREADRRIESVEALPQDWFDTLRGPFGGWSEDQPPRPPPDPAKRLESTVVPAVVGLVASVMRGGCLVLGGFAMTTGFFLRRTASVKAELSRLRTRVEALERSQRSLP